MPIEKIMMFLPALFCWASAIQSQTALDVERERPLIETRLQEYSKYLLLGDSVSIAGMYAVNGTIGCKKGPEILAAASVWIRSGAKNDSRHVTFKIATLTANGDLLIESGNAEGRSDKGELKYSFPYVVVWKNENGRWKIYRDVGL
jgi:hypothetical protein